MSSSRIPPGTPAAKAVASLARNLAHGVPDSPQALQRLLDHLQREIVRVAGEFTRSNDDGERLSHEYETAISQESEDSPRAKHLAELSNAADVTYNRSKAELFELCRELQAYLRDSGAPLDKALRDMREGPAQAQEDGQ